MLLQGQSHWPSLILSDSAKSSQKDVYVSAALIDPLNIGGQTELMQEYREGRHVRPQDPARRGCAVDRSSEWSHNSWASVL